MNAKFYILNFPWVFLSIEFLGLLYHELCGDCTSKVKTEILFFLSFVRLLCHLKSINIISNRMDLVFDDFSA